MYKKIGQLALSIAVSILFLWLAFRNVDLAAMWQEIKKIHLGFIAIYILTLVLVQLVRIIRWELLVRHFATLSRAALFRISNLGLMLILLLPLRLGEFARPYLLKKETGAPLSSGMGSIVVERVMDGLLVTLLFVATTFLMSGTYHIPEHLRFAGLLALVFFLVVALCLVLTLIAHEPFLRFVHRVGDKISPTLTQRVIGMLDAFVEGLRSLPNISSVAGFVAWTLAYWCMNGLGFYAVMHAFDWHLPFFSGFVVICVLAIGLMIPSGPANLGTYHGSVMLGLAIFGISNTQAAAFTMVVYPINVITVCAFGLPYVFSRKWQLKELVATQGS